LAALNAANATLEANIRVLTSAGGSAGEADQGGELA
jgi:hypothetical protein